LSKKVIQNEEIPYFAKAAYIKRGDVDNLILGKIMIKN
jgi:hypothetical protein